MRTYSKIMTAAAMVLATTAALSPALPAAAGPDGHERWAERVFTIKAPQDGLFITHAGSLPLAPFPADIPRLTEPALRSVFALGAKIRDASGDIVGFATEFENVLPDTDFAAGRVHSRTLWTLFLPDQGSITIDQFERGDAAAATVFAPALRTGQPWVGDLTTRTTDGNSGAIVGGTDQFAGITGSAAEFDRIYRFDPRTGELVTDIQLRLRYRISMPPIPGHGRTVQRSFFAATPDGIVALTHSGAIPVGPFPADISRFTDPPLNSAFMLAGKLTDANGQTIGLVTELEVLLPDSDLAAGRLRNRSLWTFFIPGRGSIVFDERENQDDFVTKVVLPVLRTGTPWTGDLSLRTTVPGSATIVGGTGEFAGITGTGVELGRVRGLDPVARTLTGVSEVQLRYRLPR